MEYDLRIWGGRVGVPDDAYRLENGVTQIKDEKSQHEWNGIFPVDKNIDDHNTDIERQLDDDGQQISVDELDKPLVNSFKQVIKRKQGGAHEKEK